MYIHTHTQKHTYTGLPIWLNGKESFCNAGDVGSISGLGRYPEKENSNPLQYSCLEYSIDRGAWWVIVHRVAKGQTMTIVFSWQNSISLCPTSFCTPRPNLPVTAAVS